MMKVTALYGLYFFYGVRWQSAVHENVQGNKAAKIE